MGHLSAGKRLKSTPSLQMCSQEAVLCPGGALSAVRGASRGGEEPLPVPGSAGGREGAGQPTGAGPH